MIDYEKIAGVYRIVMPTEQRQKAVADAQRDGRGTKSRVTVKVGIEGLEKALVMNSQEFSAFKRGLLRGDE